MNTKATNTTATTAKTPKMPDKADNGPIKAGHKNQGAEHQGEAGPATTKPDKAAQRDRFGLRDGSRVSQAVSLFSRKDGATMKEVKEATGSGQYNILNWLERQGHKVTRKDGIITVIPKILAMLAVTVSLAMAPGSFIKAQTAEAREMMATLINLNGHLCARVISVSPLRMDRAYEVICVEYRGGQGTVTYIVNMKTGIASRN